MAWHRVALGREIRSWDDWLQALHRPVESWSVHEVVFWANLPQHQGGADMAWMAKKLEQQQVDGALLMALKERDLLAHMNITDMDRRRAVMKAIQTLAVYSRDVASGRLPVPFFQDTRPLLAGTVRGAALPSTAEHSTGGNAASTGAQRAASLAPSPPSLPAAAQQRTAATRAAAALEEKLQTLQKLKAAQQDVFR